MVYKLTEDIKKVEKLLKFLTSPNLKFPLFNIQDKKLNNLYYKIKKKSNYGKVSLEEKIEILDYLLFWLLYINESRILKEGKDEKNKELMEVITKFSNYHEIVARNHGLDVEYLSEGVNRLIALVTHSCQLDCQYCSVGKYDSHIDEETIKKVIDFLFTSKKSIVELQFFGGEPLLRFDILKKAVWYAKKLSDNNSKEVKFLLTTNGIALNDEIIDFLIANKFTIEFSIDGDKETQLKYRKNSSGINYYDVLINNLFKLRDKGADFSIISVVMPENIENLYSNVKFFLDNGLGDIQINYALGNYWNKSSKEELFRQIRATQNLFSNYSKFNFMNNFSNRSEPVVLNAEITADCDGVLFFETGICLETEFEKLKRDFKISEIDDCKNINTIFSTRFKNFYRLVNVYSNRKEEFRKVILNNINVGMELKKYNYFLNESPRQYNIDRKKRFQGNDLTITLRCNNNCLFCPKEFLYDICLKDSFTDLKHNLEELRKVSDSVTISGGEVTILECFFDMLSLCKKLDFRRVSIITNGRKFSNMEFANLAYSKGIDDFGVSVYSSNPEVHDRITQVEGSFDETIQGLKNLVFLGAVVRVNITISRYNEKDITKTIKSLYKMGIRKFQLISVVSRYSEHVYDTDVVREEVIELSKVGLKGAEIVLKGFDDNIFQGISSFSDVFFSFEPHEFKTFFSQNSECGLRYLRNVNDLTKNEPQLGFIDKKINYLAYMAYKLLNDDLYPPCSLGDKMDWHEILRGWGKTIDYFKKGLAPQKIGLYVHIPFCVTKCKFCFCCSVKIPKNHKEIDLYLDFIEKKANYFKNVFRGIKMTSLYVGGGTPSILSEKQLNRFFDIIYSRFDFETNSAIIFEATPLTFNRKKAEILKKKGGVTRLTFGIQTFNKDILLEMDRIQSSNMVEAAIKAANDSNIPFVNCDYIVNLPNQTKEVIREDLTEISKYSPHSVHLNNFKPLLNTSIDKENSIRTSVSDREEKWLFAQDILIKEGYVPHEGFFLRKNTEPVDNAQETALRKHNSSLLGLGYFTMSHSYGNYWYEYVNVTSKGNLEPINDIKGENFYYRGINCNKDEEMRRFVINNFKDNSLSISQFKENFNIDILSYFRKELNFFKRIGRLKIREDKVDIKVNNVREFEVLNKIFFSDNMKNRFDKCFGKDYDEKTDYFKILKDFYSGVEK